MKTKTIVSEVLNFDNMKWCVENDFQVYLVPLDSTGKGKYRIGVRRKGITTEGKDFIYVNNLRIDSKETLTEAIFKNAQEASNNVNLVYKILREKYGV